MMLNNGYQARGLVAWDGAAAYPREITHWNNVSFQFENIGAAALAAPAVFNLVSYAPLAANPCLPDLATATPVLDTITCTGMPFSGAVGAPVVLTIPTGTASAAVCWAAVACRPNRFIGLVSVSGTANVRATMVLTGPSQ